VGSSPITRQPLGRYATRSSQTNHALQRRSPTSPADLAPGVSSSISTSTNHPPSTRPLRYTTLHPGSVEFHLDTGEGPGQHQPSAYLRQTGYNDVQPLLHLHIRDSTRHQDTNDVGVLSAVQPQQAYFPGADNKAA